MNEIESIEIDKLTLLERNPRRITKDQMQSLCNSIKEDPEFLICRPVLVNDVGDKMIVYAGNQRLKAAQKLGWNKIPCIVDHALDEETMRKRIIKDNKTNGEFDWDLLANEWEIDDLLDSGFTADELVGKIQDIETIESEEKEVLEPPKDPITQKGDLYELNGHRLYCGDSTLADDVNHCLNGAMPILMVTDPPYGVNYDPSWRKNIKGKYGKGTKALGKVQNDDQVNWSLAWHLFPGSIAYIWHAAKYCSDVQKSLEDAQFEIISQIIWVKHHFSLSRGDYHWQHEPCWYTVKKGHQHNWQGSRKESTVWEISNLNTFGKGKIEEENKRTAHSTQKPIECMEKPIRNNSSEREAIYDPFLGSGSTLIAAEKTNRICYGLEIDPAYCDIIVERWKNFMIKNNKPYEIKKNGEKV